MIGMGRRWWQSIMISLDEAPLDVDQKNQLRHYTVIVLVGVPTMVGYGLYNILMDHYLLAGIIFVSSFGLTAGWAILRKLKDGRIVYRVNSLIFVLLVLYMLVIGGRDGSKILWMYIYPLIAFFLLGKQEGLVWVGCVFGVALVLLWVPMGMWPVYPYHPEFKIRFVTSYIVVSAITFWFEYFRYRYRTGMEAEHRKLEQEKQHLQTEIKERKKAENEKEQLILKLKEALEKVKTLTGLIPICANCHSIRDDQGYWNRLEGYIQKHSDAEFSHSICPECQKKLYPWLYPEE